MAMRFIETHAGNIGQKRKQVQRACDSCRRRKRRCCHAGSSTSSRALENEETSQLLSEAVAPNDSPADPGVTLGDRNDDAVRAGSLSQSRFIGDLNPEGELLSATSPDTARRSSSFNENLGTWLAEKLRSNGGDGSVSTQTSNGMFSGSASLTHKMLVHVLQQECLSSLPPKAHLDEILTFFTGKIQPILPIIDGSSLRENPSDDPPGILLSQAVCLLASMNPQCKRWLVLPGSDFALQPRDFARRTFSAMRCSIDVGLVSDKLCLLQAMACMGLFTEGPDGAYIASEFCARTVHAALCLGLHFAGGHKGQADDLNVTLLCCVWAIDRLNAASHGRAVALHERDIGRDLDDCFSRQRPEFRLLLRTVSLLDQVIGLYRPFTSSQDPVSEITLPSLEEIMAQADALGIPTFALATIETLYNAVAILSCRTKISGPFTVSSAALARQGYSVSRLMSLMRPEFRDQIVMLPFVPYSLSLALSIAYREMRLSKVPLHRALARHDLQTSCDILEELAEHFWGALNISNIGKMTLKEMDRVVATVQDSKGQGGQAIPGESERSDARRYLPLESVHEPQSSIPDHPISANNVASDGEISGDTDLPLFGEVSDLDVFSMFDPGFDLDSVDAYFESNLGLSGGSSAL